MDGNSIEPRAEWSPAFVSIEPAASEDENVLSEIFRVLDVPAKSEAEPVDPDRVIAMERFGVAGSPVSQMALL